MHSLDSQPDRMEIVLMPTYEFRCDGDKTMIEIQQGFHDGTIPSCPLCGKDMKKIFSATPVHFKGTGFYKTGG